ncbi:MAG: ABC transporter permease [Firmicutes bacterium]|jgi:ABC-2 type transport system permease protein|nr:ABC transporter permease [Bacillota bacterium]
MAMRDGLSAVKTAAWLGWQMDSNWADPFLFAVYSVAKPLAGALILLFIYRVVGRGASDTGFFANMYVGNAFFALVGQVTLGMSWVIIEDREFFRMIRYIYTSKAQYRLYLLGRGLSKLAVAMISVLVLMIFGRFVLSVPVRISTVNWPLLSSVLALGLVCSIGVGFVMASLMFFIARHGGSTSEAVTGLLYLLCGVLYPVSALPLWAQAVSRIIPLTYWVEALRRAVLGDDIARQFTGAWAGGTRGLLMVLALSAAAVLALGLFLFHVGERSAKARGVIDLAQDY